MASQSFTTASDRGAAEAQVRLVQIVSAVVEELHPGQAAAVTLDATIDRDLGLDSLARVELVARAERAFGVALPEQVFATIETPRDLLRAVTAASGAKLAFVPPVVQPAAPEKAAVAPPDLETLTAVLDWHVANHPDRPHIRLYSDTDAGQVITYRDLRRGAVSQPDLTDESGVRERGHEHFPERAVAGQLALEPAIRGLDLQHLAAERKTRVESNEPGAIQEQHACRGYVGHRRSQDREP